MNSVLIIGMGRFGISLAKKFIDMGKYVVAVDSNEDSIDEVKRFVTEAKIADCTKLDILKSLGVDDFDICFVCIGSNFQASLEITDQLKSLGAKMVVSKASNAIHEKFLRKNGADRTVYPERDHAEKLAVLYSISGSGIHDYTKLSEDTGIYEITVPEQWAEHSIMELNVRNKYKINILAIKKDDDGIILPSAEYVFDKDDRALTFGTQKDMEKLFSRLK